MRIRLCKMPFLTNSYDTVIDFENESSRENYFNNVPYETLDINTKVGSALESISVSKNLNEVNEYDYLYLTYNNKMYFYFINLKEMINENNTRLYLQKDVFTTHQFDVKLNDSFVDRCHVNRWDGDIPTRNTLEEGLDYGETIQIGESEEIQDFSSTVIMASSVPIGRLNQADPELPGASGGSAGSPSEGLLSKRGFIYLKQEEAFAPYPFDVEGNGMNTAGYGTHSVYQEENYRKLAPFPTTEQKASEVLDQMATNNFAIPVRNLIQDAGLDLSKIKSNQFDVWVSIALNYGLGGLKKRQAWQHFLKNPNDVDTIANLIAGESANANRRRREAEIYRSGKYPTEAEKEIGKYNQSGSLVGKVEFPGFIPARYQGEATDSLQQKVVQSARKLIGKPYRWGGNYPPLGSSDGTDCSGLCQWAYNDIGKGDVVPGRWTTETMPKFGKHINKSDIQLGDCIITDGHVVMYSGVKDGKHRIVEAPSSGKLIRERDYTFPSNIVGIRRYL